jgi:predicted AlkP superfamily pyrophosphatase or phosphodiesterase
MPISRRRPHRHPACRLAWIGACLVLAITAFPSPSRAAHRVVIVSIDGLRPDVALRADMPALRSLMARGSFTMFAATTDVAITLPSHMSMLTGVPPPKHGITYNSDPKPEDLKEPAWPTLFELAHRAGLTTAMSAGKSKFSVFARPGTLDGVFVPPRGETASDSAVADAAVRWIMTRRPQVLFVHLPSMDLSGHENGWGSPAQVADASIVDRALGRIVDALARAGLTDSTLVIVSADHGGAGGTHGGTDARNHFIPWIVAGPGVRRDFDLTREPSLWIRTEDTFATACAWLGLAIEKPVDGRAVTEIFEPTPGPH